MRVCVTVIESRCFHTIYNHVSSFFYYVPFHRHVHYIVIPVKLKAETFSHSHHVVSLHSTRNYLKICIFFCVLHNYLKRGTFLIYPTNFFIGSRVRHVLTTNCRILSVSLESPQWHNTIYKRSVLQGQSG